MARDRSNKSLIPMDFPDALKEAREGSRLKHEMMAEKLEKAVGLFSMYETGQAFPPKTTFEGILGMLKAEYKAHLRVLWKEAIPFWDKVKAEKRSHREGKKRPHVLTLKLYGYASGLGPIEQAEIDEEVRVAGTGLEGIKNVNELHALKVKDDSMRDAGVLKGDLIVVRETNSPENRIVVAVIAKPDGEVRITLKWWRQDGDKVRLEPAIPDYEAEEYPAGMVAPYGYLVAVTRIIPPSEAIAKKAGKARKAG